MEVNNRFIDLGKAILNLKIKSIDSLEYLIDFFLVVIFPTVEDFGELLDVGHGGGSML
jgi:hypothetical protein